MVSVAESVGVGKAEVVGSWVGGEGVEEGV